MRALKRRVDAEEKEQTLSAVSMEMMAGDGGIMTEGGACLTLPDLLDPAAAKSWRKRVERENLMWWDILPPCLPKPSSFNCWCLFPSFHSHLCRMTALAITHSQTPPGMTHTPACTQMEAACSDVCSHSFSHADSKKKKNRSQKHTFSWLNIHSQGCFHLGHAGLNDSVENAEWRTWAGHRQSARGKNCCLDVQ